MKSAALRDAMVARVKEAFGNWRTFADMPEADESTVYDIRVKFKADLSKDDMSAPILYAEALHSMCAVSTPVARIGAHEMVGISDPGAEGAGQGLDARAEIVLD
jgi:hypothetical protein